MISQTSDHVNAYGQWCECEEGTWNWSSGISRCPASFGIRLSSGEREDDMSLSSESPRLEINARGDTINRPIVAHNRISAPTQI
jgi:hypothetical protein